MLTGIPKIISPQLIKILMEMGHGDEIVIADANFPAASVAKETCTGECIYSPGAGTPEFLDALLKLMPLDYAVDCPVTGMAQPEDSDVPEIHERFKEILASYGYAEDRISFVPRFDFYSRAKKSYAVVSTGESARFANLIIKKESLRNRRMELME